MFKIGTACMIDSGKSYYDPGGTIWNDTIECEIGNWNYTSDYLITPLSSCLHIVRQNSFNRSSYLRSLISGLSLVVSSIFVSSISMYVVLFHDMYSSVCEDVSDHQPLQDPAHMSRRPAVEREADL